MIFCIEKQRSNLNKFNKKLKIFDDARLLLLTLNHKHQK